MILGVIYVEKKQDTFLYTVRPEDTIESICNRFDVTKEQIYGYNEITYIYPYQIIEIAKKCND